jgi:thymidine phosphorylase
MVAAQGGDLEAPRPLAPASEIAAEGAGHVTRIDAEALGLGVIELGGGRKRQGDRVDPAVGLEMLVRIGDAVTPGQPLLKVFGEPEPELRARLGRAIELGEAEPHAPTLIQGAPE